MRQFHYVDIAGYAEKVAVLPRKSGIISGILGKIKILPA
jgi:hypothetical protein